MVWCRLTLDKGSISTNSHDCVAKQIVSAINITRCAEAAAAAAMRYRNGAYLLA